MFSIVILLALTGQTPTGAPEPPISEITAEYNKFEDRTSVALKIARFRDEEDGLNFFALILHHEGKARPTQLKEFIYLVIVRHGRDWKYRTHHDLKMACGDDRVLHFGDEYNFELRKDIHQETISTAMLRTTLRKSLDKDENIEVKIGDSEPIVLCAKERARMKSYLDYLDRYPSD
jgi:hypothetical protein